MIDEKNQTVDWEAFEWLHARLCLGIGGDEL